MVDLDELMRLHAAATPVPWEHKIDDAFDDPSIHDITPYVASFARPDDAAYICAACNAVPELVARIRELESQLNTASLKHFSALEPCRIVSNNNSTPPEWLMHRFTEVK